MQRCTALLRSRSGRSDVVDDLPGTVFLLLPCGHVLTTRFGSLPIHRLSSADPRTDRDADVPTDQHLGARGLPRQGRSVRVEECAPSLENLVVAAHWTVADEHGRF